MQLGIFAKTFPGTDPRQVLQQVKDAGFATTQFNMACCGLPSLPDRIDAATVAAIAEASRSTGVALCAMSATFNMIHPNPQVRLDGLRRLRVLADASRQLAIPLLTLCTGTRDPDDQWRHHPDNALPAAWTDLLDSMRAAVAVADEFGLTVGIEPELANVVDSAPKARRLLDELRSQHLAIVLDPANLFETAPLPEQHRLVDQAIELLAPAIAMAHAKDRTPDGAFATAGTGVLDYDHYLAGLRRIRFDGPLVTHGLAAHEAPAVAAFLQARLAA
ncbi:MAG TPA: sugar phosphate isomerase/epimerase [Geminicoccus sp.]|jgi:sugar phosphate isomerase/epimerase|uniref:sugar phosphate isomerase/epimerase family protein n=1 Tax=Geminicoccus sp. TaxID=2024832 RepID=UPI002E3614CA|nr:sugar phosphate isomerase/epimerase [Geminicoccus sp.]HEX2525146.1 sugar phosphate isomerase/epimerase [Geminicoccus sp.]